MLLLAGQYDVGLPPRNAAEYAGLFGHAELAVQPSAGHVPWLGDLAWFTVRAALFLTMRILIPQARTSCNADHEASQMSRDRQRGTILWVRMFSAPRWALPAMFGRPIRRADR